MPADQAFVANQLSDMSALRAFVVPGLDDAVSVRAAAQTAGSLGFNALLAWTADAADPAAQNCPLAAIDLFQASAHESGLQAWMVIVPDRVASDHALARVTAPGAFRTPPPAAVPVIDPRRPFARQHGIVAVRRPDDAAWRAWWLARLQRLRETGIDGFAYVGSLATGDRLADFLAADYKVVRISRLDEGKFGASSAESVACMLVENDAAATDVAASIAYTALLSQGWAFAGEVDGFGEATVSGLNSILAMGAAGKVRNWTGVGAPLAILSRPIDDGALVLIHNRGAHPAPWPPAAMPPMPWQAFAAVPGSRLPGDVVAPGEVCLLHARALPAVTPPPRIAAVNAADPAARVVIGGMSPAVDAGRFAIKRVLGETITVRADIFTDGHEQLAAEVLVRAADDSGWTRHRMIAEPNDVWSVSFALARLGRHEMHIEAWIDIWGGFVRDLRKKYDAGQDVALEIREARALIGHAARVAPADLVATLEGVLAHLDRAPQESAVALLLGAKLAAAMSATDERRFLHRGFTQPIEVEREAARFSSWYELFPRSQTRDRNGHGTFADVAGRLPHLAAMGFDTLYFPPIHPIGRRNRKGKNNSLTPAADDVGSPYAIGAAEGGHQAIHSQLGTLPDFRQLIAAARSHGLEIALDFAIQCAPDHPWLTEHPGWFAWRPDGSIKYAENPPKKYQDIVNVDFYAPGSIPTLWHALRDVVLYWAEQGVLTFRVDNPHTKPLPFWEWMIAEVKARFPEAIFLSEAFTRPKPMYQLAKVGFSQSYTYFTWRNEKAELSEYLAELAHSDVAEFFRPHFFVNTPDINPLFLQHSGRAGFLIRAALAATIGGLWGVYAGFELCEAAALPGREEYLDAEKYEIRPRPDRAPGDIVDEITALNRLRRAEPALQSHKGLVLHNVFNDHMIYFEKTAPGHADRILVAISLDPHGVQEGEFEVPLWLFDLPDSGSVHVHDLLGGDKFDWIGKRQRIRLTPDRPYAIWRIDAASRA